MTGPRRPRISVRKQPKQERSKQLVADILTAASRVLAREGAHRFTAARVAEETGISVGSLYQYFPNKEAILFRLQSDEWDQTSELLASILHDKSVAHLERLRTAVREFVRTECEEAEMRNALEHAAPLYRDAPEAIIRQQAGRESAREFIREVLPRVSEHQRIPVADIMIMTLKAVGKQLSEGDFTPVELEARTCAMADMFCIYLESLRKQDLTSQPAEERI
jgi:AcrR family transcriptional regulator